MTTILNVVSSLLGSNHKWVENTNRTQPMYCVCITSILHMYCWYRTIVIRNWNFGQLKILKAEKLCMCRYLRKYVNVCQLNEVLVKGRFGNNTPLQNKNKHRFDRQNLIDFQMLQWQKLSLHWILSNTHN